MCFLSLFLSELNDWKKSPVLWRQSTPSKVSKYGVFIGPYFPAFGLNTGKYGLSRVYWLCCSSGCWSSRWHAYWNFSSFVREQTWLFFKKTINSQAVVGSNLMFLDVSTGFPGSVHNARMLRASKLYQICEADELLTRPEKIIEGMRVRLLLLEDGAYFSTTWLVKPYPSNIRLTGS